MNDDFGSSQSWLAIEVEHFDTRLVSSCRCIIDQAVGVCVISDAIHGVWLHFTSGTALLWQ